MCPRMKFLSSNFIGLKNIILLIGSSVLKKFLFQRLDVPFLTQMPLFPAAGEGNDSSCCSRRCEKNTEHVLVSSSCSGGTTSLYPDCLQLLQSSIQSKSLEQGKLVHQHLIKNSNTSPLVLDKLTRLYLACNELELARRIFHSIPDPKRNNNVILVEPDDQGSCLGRTVWSSR